MVSESIGERVESEQHVGEDPEVETDRADTGGDDSAEGKAASAATIGVVGARRAGGRRRAGAVALESNGAGGGGVALLNRQPNLLPSWGGQQPQVQEEDSEPMPGSVTPHVQYAAEPGSFQSKPLSKLDSDVIPIDVKSDGTPSAGTPSDGAESDGAESDGAESDGAESDGTESDGAESDGAESDGAESDGAESVAESGVEEVAAAAALPPLHNWTKGKWKPAGASAATAREASAASVAAVSSGSAAKPSMRRVDPPVEANVDTQLHLHGLILAPKLLRNRK